MFGIINIMNERRKRELLKQMKTYREDIHICVDKTNNSLYKKISSEMKQCQHEDCIISDCEFIKKDSLGNSFYKCVKYYDDISKN
jgi:ribosome recycling factor